MKNNSDVIAIEENIKKACLCCVYYSDLIGLDCPSFDECMEEELKTIHDINRKRNKDINQ